MSDLFSRDLASLAAALSSSAAFLTWIGNEPPEEHIYFYYVTPGEAPPRFCLLSHGADWRRDSESYQPNAFITTPEIVMHFEQDVDRSISVSESFSAMMQHIGDIMLDLEENESVAQLAGWRIFEEDPSRAPKKADADSVRVQILVRRVPWSTL